MTAEENRKWLEEEFELHGYELWAVKPIIDAIIKDGFDMGGWTIQGQHHPQIITFQYSDGKHYFDINLSICGQRAQRVSSLRL